ncbi:MAG: chromosome partitioning protein ParA [Acholeplasmatales bacterium]|nr:MAG: chromosome partitioning protein ParA [Acholeplasmatales bacterium]
MSQLEDLKKALGALIDPSSGVTLHEQDSLKYVSIDDERRVTVVVTMKSLDDKGKQTLTRAIAKVVKIDFKYHGLKVDVEAMKDPDALRSNEKQPAYIGIASGKGGVGKSTIAANLALALTRLGQKVGLMDADIYGSSIPTLFDMEIVLPKADENEKIIPFVARDIQIISTEFFLTDEKPLMWRGPMLGKMLGHFFDDVAWGPNLDFMIIDLPPGTGDVAMDIQRLIPATEMIIVTTPHPSAAHVAVKAGFMAKELKHHLIGVIENMSYYKHGDTRLTLFGEGGGRQVADRLETDLLAQLALAQPKNGHHSLYDMHEQAGIDFLGIANKLLKSRP